MRIATSGSFRLIKMLSEESAPQFNVINRPAQYKVGRWRGGHRSGDVGWPATFEITPVYQLVPTWLIGAIRAEYCSPAPPVLEYDQDGKLLASWGGPGQGYEWTTTEHGIFVDAKDNVWPGGNGAKDAQVLKFTAQGKFPVQFGQ